MTIFSSGIVDELGSLSLSTAAIRSPVGESASDE